MLNNTNYFTILFSYSFNISNAPHLRLKRQHSNHNVHASLFGKIEIFLRFFDCLHLLLVLQLDFVWRFFRRLAKVNAV